MWLPSSDRVIRLHRLKLQAQLRGPGNISGLEMRNLLMTCIAAQTVSGVRNVMSVYCRCMSVGPSCTCYNVELGCYSVISSVIVVTTDMCS